MSGDEAVARGAYEAGCHLAAAYPGTPSTEILENIGAKYKDDIYSQWACNEKVAAEIAAGASIGGERALCAMKHVGMNVAADPIFTMGYAGVNGGLVIVSADDPGCHSSQNEQDNRLYAQHAKLACVEAADSQECIDFTKEAFELSEKFDIPVLFRMTTRVCHSKSVVELGERKEVEVKKYERNIGKYAMLPSTARARHKIREELLLEMAEYGNDCPFNKVEEVAGSKVGIITSGISYQYVKEVFEDSVSVLKLGLTYPLPSKLLSDFASKYETVYVVEEGEPYLENALKALGFTGVIGKDKLPILGEFDTGVVRDCLTEATKPESYKVETVAPGRPPVLCAGCPHRGFYYALSTKMKNFVSAGDIGCYALSLHAPLNGFDYSICMGSGISSIIGLSKALERQGDKRKAIGQLGDSTFFHSGLNSLIDVVASEANVVACVLDNSITAMTGHQENPGTAKNLMGYETPQIDIVSLIKATGLDESRIRVVSAIDLDACKKALDDAYATEGPFVIVTKEPCALIKEVAKSKANMYCEIDQDKCVGCKACMKIACPAMAFSDGKAQIVDKGNCTACGVCMQLCKFDAIGKVGE